MNLAHAHLPYDKKTRRGKIRGEVVKVLRVKA